MSDSHDYSVFYPAGSAASGVEGELDRSYDDKTLSIGKKMITDSLAEEPEENRLSDDLKI